MASVPLNPLHATSTDDIEKTYQKVTLQRLQLTAPEMGVTAVVGTLVAILARLLVPDPEYAALRVLLLPLTALFAYLIGRVSSVRAYGWCCMGVIATIMFNNYLGALGTDRPLMYFMPAAIIVVITTSFFWITMAQWVGGTIACYAFYLPFLIDHTANRADTVFALLFSVTALATGFVTHARVQDYRRCVFDQERQMAELSATDTLTGARRRAEFLRQAEQADINAKATGSPLTLLYLDIDHFKLLNDSHGHAAGDAVLRGMADALQRALRATDIFGRLGGEEFCVLLPDQSERHAQALAERLRPLLASVPRPDRPLTVSAGIATLRAGESIAQTLHRADLAMLRAKQSGRDTVCIAD